MTTYEEFEAVARYQFRKLNEEWKRLYISDDDDASVELFTEDAKHSPPPIRAFAGAVLDEVMDSLLEKLQEEFPPEVIAELGENAAYGFAMGAIYTTAKVLAIRCYEMGSRLSKELAYDDLVPCPCKSDPIGEIEAFLVEQAEVGLHLEGDGWLVKNFDFGLAEQLKGKAH